MTVRVSDCAFLLAILNDGRDHSVTEIIEASQRERGYGMTVHSRAADLRKRGYTILQRSDRSNGRVISFYRLVTSLASPAPEDTDSTLRASDGAGDASENGPDGESGAATDGGGHSPTAAGTDDVQTHPAPDSPAGQLSLIPSAAAPGAYQEAA